MAKKSGYLERIEKDRQDILTAGEKLGFQKACDFVAMALNDPDCMGKGVMSGERISRIMDYAIALENAYHGAFETADNVEADVWQERLDTRQKKIFGEKFQPFNLRYPQVKAIQYGRRKV